MGVLRGIGYFIAIIILIGGIVAFFVHPLLGIGPIVTAVIIMYVLHKGAQVKAIHNDIRALRMMEEEKLRQQVEAERRDALKRKYVLGNWTEVDDGANKNNGA